LSRTLSSASKCYYQPRNTIQFSYTIGDLSDPLDQAHRELASDSRVATGPDGDAGGRRPPHRGRRRDRGIRGAFPPWHSPRRHRLSDPRHPPPGCPDHRPVLPSIQESRGKAVSEQTSQGKITSGVKEM
jgi:hypothetical protein